ncbi:hypothetical protein niasHT_014829 [Heterodera trifolii]|uniref:Uncharacterized protein n=1 Tax=Heterodera trifolii TaxID=157864 RepID=A0ABD2L7K2_9BILA
MLLHQEKEPLWVDPRRGSRLYANRGKLRKSKSPALLGGEAFSDREQRTLEKFHERFERERKIAREERKRRSNERRLESETEEESDEELELDKENTDSEEMDNTEIRKGRENDEEAIDHNGKEKVERNDKRKSHSGDKEEKKAQKGRKGY